MMLSEQVKVVGYYWGVIGCGWPRGTVMFTMPVMIVSGKLYIFQCMYVICTVSRLPNG